jgi:3-deoxy-7-phosphoheptulonate synthase
MFRTTDDLRVTTLRPLIPPAILHEELPLTRTASKLVAETRQRATRIIQGQDDRLLIIAGPCSIHDPKAALEYGSLLLEQSRRFEEELCLIMRVYFEKPRTTVGWKGLINDPRLDGSFEINTGLRTARKLLVNLLDMGLPAGTEFLDTISPQFIVDLISWGAIGARTSESQIHRELASGLSVPVGFKNGTDGNIQITMDGIRAAQHPHHFLGVTKQGIAAIVATKGNDACHVILRGSNAGPNYSPDDIQATVHALEKAHLTNRLMVDCSHGNSSKDFRRQPLVAVSIAEQLAAGQEAICGVMLESHLVEGKQSVSAGRSLVYGQSITDACLGWKETVPVLELLAKAVKARRKQKKGAKRPSSPIAKKGNV